MVRKWPRLVVGSSPLFADHKGTKKHMGSGLVWQYRVG